MQRRFVAPINRVAANEQEAGARVLTRSRRERSTRRSLQAAFHRLGKDKPRELIPMRRNTTPSYRLAATLPRLLREARFLPLAVIKTRRQFRFTDSSRPRHSRQRSPEFITPALRSSYRRVSMNAPPRTYRHTTSLLSHVDV